MANPIRGQVPFKVLGRDFYIQYGTREIAEVQAALGFRRPDPQQPDTVEEVDVPVYLDGNEERPKLDDDGQQVFRRQRVLVNARERQRRMLAAFDACIMNPDPEAKVAFLRVGLRPWQREHPGRQYTEEWLQGIVQALGLTRIGMLHLEALAQGCYLTGEEADDEGKAEAASVSST